MCNGVCVHVRARVCVCVCLFVQVLSDMCREMRTCLERSKLELCVWSNDASLSYLQAEMRALIGKLEYVLPACLP